YEDDYREAVEEMVKAKVEGGEVKRTPEAKKSSGEVVELLAALQRSVDAAKTARGEKPADSDDESESDSDGKKTAKKTAKKSAAKKATAKKTTKKAAKKTPAKKAS
ncbi:MAG: Ku protein, partial [Marmoricola sp.]